MGYEDSLIFLCAPSPVSEWFCSKESMTEVAFIYCVCG